MTSADLVVQRLVEAASELGIPELLDLSESWASVDTLDREFEVSDAEIRVSFPEAPTAYELALTLDEIDREARRMVAALQRGLRVNALRGRGTRLVPTRDGLVVRAATPGSLDVALMLGGLYQAVTSQPLSFALNLAALVGYTRASIRTATTKRTRNAVSVRLPRHAEARSAGARAQAEVSQPDILIEGSYSRVTIRYQSDDGTWLEVDCVD